MLFSCLVPVCLGDVETKNSHHEYPNTNIESVRHVCRHLGWVPGGWDKVWTATSRSRASIMAPGGHVLARFCEFEVLCGAGDIDNSTSTLNYWYEPYILLLLCANEDPSAWTAVWNDTCRSSKRFWFPEDAIWADFWDFWDSGRGWWYK